MKRLLSVLLAVCLLAVCLPLSASAETFEGSCGEDATWVLDTSTGVLTISGTGPMKDIRYFDDVPWYGQRNNIKKIVVNSGITHIGRCAFNSTAAVTAELPNTVTSIGQSAFAYSTKLEKCVLPDGVTSIGTTAFFDCQSLKLTRLPSALTSLGDNAFKKCPNIGPVLEFPEGVTNIPDSAFCECAGIKKLTLHEGIENIGSYAFQKTSIQKVVIPSTAKKVGKGAFEDCTSLRFVDMKGGTYLGSWAFSGCSVLEKINLPNTLVEVAPDYNGYVFFRCPKLNYLYFPASVTSLNIRGCGDSLKTVCVVNPECNIRYDLGVVGKTTIYGENDSTAETFAKSKGYSFKLLGSQPKPPADPVINDDITGPGGEDPANPSAPQFKDVPANAFYADAVAWAVKNDITSGTSNTTFSPNAPCTRGQIMTFLWRASGKPEPTSTRNPFVDVSSGEYYYKAVLWAVENEITSGTDATHFSPNATCTRGQSMTFLWRAKGKPKGSSISFSDVKNGQYYTDAVKWAVGNKITSGTSDTTFSPEQSCTRGQIVTFLYKAYK